MAVSEQPRLLLDKVKFPEGPRWHDGELWFSEIHGHRVIAVDPEGRSRVAIQFPTRPSGLGFLPDGSPLIVAMRKPRALFVQRPEGLRVLADLESIPGDFLNDMVVDGRGRAYIGFRRDRTGAGFDPGPEGIVLVEPDGAFRIVAEGQRGPNGSVITADGRTLIVAETHARRLTSFEIAEDGSLGAAEPFAETGEAHPDGICLDAEGAVWIGGGIEFRRILKGGAIAGAVKPGSEGMAATACMLGGADRRTLFLLTHWPEPRLGAMVDPEEDVTSPLRGSVESVEVGVPGAGWP